MKCKDCKIKPIIELLIEIREASVFTRTTMCEKHFFIWFFENFNTKKHPNYNILYDNIVKKTMEIEII